MKIQDDMEIQSIWFIVWIKNGSVMLDFYIQFSFVIISMNFRLKGLKYR